MQTLFTSVMVLIILTLPRQQAIDGLPFKDWGEFLSLAVIPITYGLVALLKGVVNGEENPPLVSDRWWPLASFVIALFLAYLATTFMDVFDPVFRLMIGLAYGLAASGLYSWKRTLVDGK